MLVNPNVAPVIPTGSTAPPKSDLCYAFTAAKNIIPEYDCTDKALRQQLLLSVDEIFVSSLRHKYIGYDNTTTREILNHFYSTFSNISPSDLQYNDARLCTLYDANHPIENLTDQIENAAKYTAAGQTPHTTNKVVNIA